MRNQLYAIFRRAQAKVNIEQTIFLSFYTDLYLCGTFGNITMRIDEKALYIIMGIQVDEAPPPAEIGGLKTTIYSQMYH